jgi:hypothetical protein
MPKASAGEARSRSDDASRRHQHCCKNAFHDRIPHFAPPLDVLDVIICAQATFNLPCFALTALALIRTSSRTIDAPNSTHRDEQKRFIGKIDLAAAECHDQDPQPVIAVQPPPELGP